MSDVLLSFGAQNIKGDASKMLKDIQEAFSIETVNVNVGLKVDDRALSVFRNELTKIVNGITLTNGAPIKLRIDGVGEIESGMESAKKGLKSLGLDAKSAMKQLSSEYIKMRENLGKLSGLNSGKSKIAYNEYLQQAKNMKLLHDEVKNGTISYDEYIEKLGRIKQAAAKAQQALTEYRSAIKQAEEDSKKPKIGEMSESQAVSKYEQLGKKIAALEVKAKNFSSASGVDWANRDLEEYMKQIERLKSLQEYLVRGPMPTDKFNAEIADINNELSVLEKRLRVFSTDADPSKALIAGTKEYEAALARVGREIDNTRKKVNEWTAAKSGDTSKDYKVLVESLRELEKLYSDISSGAITKGGADKTLDGIISKTSVAAKNIKGLERDAKSVDDRFKAMLGKFASWFSVSQAILFAVDATKKMVATVIELDGAMTELKKVTDESDATYDRFLDNAGTRAKEIGASLTDVVAATADFARLGYNLNEASELAETAIVYKNVADGIENISDASSSIISTVKAFGLETNQAMSIVDKFNEVSNNFAISSEGIGIAIQKSGAALHAAGNDLDESIALATAANTVIQNPEVVGKFCPTAQQCVA